MLALGQQSGVGDELKSCALTIKKEILELNKARTNQRSRRGL